MFHKLSILLIVLMLSLIALSACGGSGGTASEPAVAPNSESATSTEQKKPAGETGAGAAPAAAGMRTFVIVPEQSKASYMVKEEFFAGALSMLGIQAGLHDTVGSTQEIEGQLQLNLDDPSKVLGSNRFTVNIATLTSDQSRRDRMIRERFLQLNQYPAAEFVATAVEGLSENYVEGEEINFKLMGDMTIRETTKPVTFDVTATLQDDTITGVATTQLRLTDFGFDPPNMANLFSVANEFTVQVELTAKES
jgi:polyisoprenoid-binding protein YceI